MDMKRLLFCICAIMTVVIAMAEDVTPAEALKQATQFVQNRIASGQHSRRAAGTPAQLTQTAKVSGLYVFNVDNSGGFVIVSNDDRTEPVLGYSDSGSFAPDNMPENMRAWLQGYADEIAWLKKHPDAAVSTSRRTGESESNIKTPIKPLVQTKWNQGKPYNNQCPCYYKNDDDSYSYSIDYKNNYKHCATGCVATAMAQVMNYHQWPVRATKNISSYTWKGNDMPSLAPVNFDWNNMRLDYSGGYTVDEATAVATLMKHCGYALEMNYGPSSGAFTHSVANALKNYFDYKATTTYVNRSFYSYANWIELIYHEIANSRPVVYGGQSTGGGHEFVCDGYQGEDYFHINWGWGGMSDSYFKLSALDPEAQGIGGSSSTDGFHYGQDAVIGIQKSTDNGSILSVHSNSVNLKINNVTFSDNPTQYEEVTVNINLRNNSTDEYDGDIGLLIDYDGETVDEVCNSFVIPAKTNSKIIQLSFTPTNSGTYTVIVYRPSESPGYLRYIYYTYGDTYQTQVNVKVASGSNSLDLSIQGISLSSPFDNGSPISLYGTTLKGSFRIANENTENYVGEVGWQLVNSSDYVISESFKEKAIAAGESLTIPFDVTGLTIGNEYRLYTLYTKNNSWNGSYIRFLTQPAIMSYAADGTISASKPSSTSYDAATNAPDALAIDVTDTNITSITPNTQPNAVYIYSGTMPSGLDNKNVIKYDGDKYTAKNITLTDNNGFYSPVYFTADSITFNYDFTFAADGEDEYGRGHGWNTLMLPFNVTKVTATDKTTHEKKDIDWFHSSDDTGKNFWVKKFTGDAVNTVNFDFTDKMEANTPYIVAFPGNKWGKKWDMSNKYLKFIGEDVAVSKGGTVSSVTGANYRFIGNTIQDNTENIYSINSDGSAFVLNKNSGSAPFRAYIKPGIYDSSVTSLAIGSEPEGTTGIEDVNLNVNKNENGNFFNLNGQRVTRPTKGLYISNGKKVIIK